MNNKDTKSDKIIIKKYSNRRLYNCNSSQYINLQNLYQLICKQKTIIIQDHSTGKDLTQQTLIQLILDLNSSKDNVFSINFLYNLIFLMSEYDQKEISDYLEICLTKLIDQKVSNKQSYNNINLLDLQLQILEFSQLHIQIEHQKVGDPQHLVAPREEVPPIPLRVLHHVEAELRRAHRRGDPLTEQLAPEDQTHRPQ